MNEELYEVFEEVEEEGNYLVQQTECRRPCLCNQGYNEVNICNLTSLITSMLRYRRIRH